MSLAILDSLPKQDRAAIERLADVADCPPELIGSEIIRAYLRLVREVPGALPRNPLSPIAGNARARGRKVAPRD